MLDELLNDFCYNRCQGTGGSCRNCLPGQFLAYMVENYSEMHFQTLKEGDNHADLANSVCKRLQEEVGLSESHLRSLVMAGISDWADLYTIDSSRSIVDDLLPGIEGNNGNDEFFIDLYEEDD